jgi:Ca2+/Na+ antiporter
MPTAAVLMIMTTYPELSRDRLMGIVYRTVPIGIALILISQFQVRYEKGSKGRFILNEAYVLLVVLWIFALLGGEPVIHQTWEEYQFSLHIWNYIMLILFVTFLNVIYYVVEYQAYKDEEHTDVPLDENEDDEPEHKGVVITTTSS